MEILATVIKRLDCLQMGAVHIGHPMGIISGMTGAAEMQWIIKKVLKTQIQHMLVIPV